VTLPYMHKPSVRRLRLASPVAGARQPVTPRGPRAAQVGSFAHTEFNQPPPSCSNTSLSAQYFT